MSKFTVLDLISLQPEGPNALELRCFSGRKGLVREIFSTEINRPGMTLVGSFDNFVGERVQIIGRGESTFLRSAKKEQILPHLESLFTYRIPCFIFCYDLEPPEYFREMSEKAGIPILLTPLDSSSLSIRLLRALDDVFAPKQTIHAVLLEVDGMGVLLQGTSGVGKSETALELIDRGHRLVADDSVLIKCINGNELWGFWSNPNMGHHMEIRGLGIINVALVYGMNSIRKQSSIEMVFHLEEWDKTKNYNRLGISDDTTTILGVTVPLITIPVKPGRNIPIIIEAAILNHRLKCQGIYSPQSFTKNLITWAEANTAGNSQVNHCDIG